ncbi:MAG: DNA-3-methyladenine glycosylase [Chthoniobacterales bacterium]
MKLSEIDAPDFDLAITLDSGQVFHWELHKDGYVGTIGDRPTYAEQRGKSLLVPAGLEGLTRRYFALDHPLAAICRALPDDPAMRAARDYCRGLRIIRQPLWECLATFITSSMKQVAHIRQMSRALRERFGEPRTIAGRQLYTFPAADVLAQAKESELRACVLGYRAKNLLRTAQLVSTGVGDLGSWRALADDKLRAQLCSLPGVGAKIANCVMLFAYERLRAFPIDVWIERVLKERYFPHARRVTALKLRSFCDTYFGEHGGYAQQYLFHHARKTTVRRRAPKPQRSGKG